MKKTALLIAFLLIFSPFSNAAWDKNEPSGTTSISDIDADVIANNTVLESLLSNPRGWNNLKVVRTNATTVTVTADQLYLETTSSLGVRITSVSEAIAITTSGVSGLQSNLSEAANTIYYIWILRKSSDGTVNGMLSTASAFTSLILPTDYDQGSLVGVVGNDNSSNFIDFIQHGRRYSFTTWIAIASGNVGSGSWTAIDLTPSTLTFFVPTVLSTYCYGSFSPYGTGGGTIEMTNSSSTTIGSNVTSNKYSGSFPSVDSVVGQFNWEFDVITADTLYWVSAAAGNVIHIHGFELNLL